MLSRKTFYRYFPDKYALVNYVFDELFERAYLSNNADKSWDEATTIFLNGLVSDQRYYANAYSFEGQNSLTDHDYKIFYQYYLQKCEETKGAPQKSADQKCSCFYGRIDRGVKPAPSRIHT